jgi:hypothetical protein
MQIKTAVIATDSSEAVQQLHTNQDDTFWRLRPIISDFKKIQDGSFFQVVKINRQDLASHAKSGISQIIAAFSCVNSFHQPHCAVLSVFGNVILDPFDLISVRCS